MASSYPQPDYANYANGGVGGGGVYNTQPVRSISPLLNSLSLHPPQKPVCYLPFFFSMNLTVVSKQVSPLPMTQYPIIQYPTTQNPTTQFPTIQYPTTQYPTIQYPTTQYPTTQVPTPQYATTQYPTASGGDAQAHVQAPPKVKGKKRECLSECSEWCHIPCFSCCYPCCCE